VSGRVVVLGGSGFLGSWVCPAFAEAGYRVRSVSRSGARPSWWPDDIESTAIDLSTVDTDGLRRALAGADVVVNAAAAVRLSTEEAMRALHVEFVDRLVDVLADIRPQPRLVQLGTSYEYGPGEVGATTTEDDQRPPTSSYGATKRHGTEAVLRAAREHRLDAVVLRAANLAGPGAFGDSLPGMVAGKLASGATRLPLAPLTSWRDYVDVRDVADAVLAAATAPDVSGLVVNIGSGAAIPVRDLVLRLIALSGVPARIVELTDRTVREPMPWQQLDVSRARQLLGWRPARDLADSLADMLAAQRQPQPGGAPL
jgi:nucleoside-diphosphate-sugar epimerase